jgi:glycerophosphoryl diester phosphodiesterase
VEAARLGAEGVELDVRRSADGALVVHHDPLLPSGAPVADTRVTDLPAWVPLLDAALDACDGLLVNVEVKNLPHEPGWDPDETVAAEVAALVVERKLVERVVVSSFTVRTLDAVRAVEPTVATGLLTMPGFDQAAAVRTAVEHGCAAVHPAHQAVTAEVVAAAHRSALAVTTWTVDDPDELRRLAGLGVDAVITNTPEVALAVLSPWR